MSSRRDFLKSTSAVAVAAAVARPSLAQQAPVLLTAEPTAPPAELAMTALQAARDAGASYADARVGRYRRLATTAKSFGMEMELVSPEEVKRMWPLMETRDLIGASWLATEIPEPEARVTWLVPEPKETSLTMTPSMT